MAYARHVEVGRYEDQQEFYLNRNTIKRINYVYKDDKLPICTLLQAAI